MVDGATRKQVKHVRTLLLGDPAVKEFRFVSRELALKRARRKFPELAKHLVTNPFPDAYEVVPSNPTSVARIEAKYGRVAGVAHVRVDRACSA